MCLDNSAAKSEKKNVQWVVKTEEVDLVQGGRKQEYHCAYAVEAYYLSRVVKISNWTADLLRSRKELKLRFGTNGHQDSI